MNAPKVVPLDFARRRSAHLTLRDRRRLKEQQRPQLTEWELQQKTLRTEFVGGFIMGLVMGVFATAGFWLLLRWVEVGGSP